MTLQEKRIPWSDRDIGQKFSIIMVYVCVGAVLCLFAYDSFEELIRGELFVVVLWALILFNILKFAWDWSKRHAG